MIDYKDKKKNVTVSINNNKIACFEDQSVLEVCRKNNIEIPTLCSHKNFSPTGSCQLCGVKVSGASKIQLSCTLKIKEGMEITTSDQDIWKYRRKILELLLSNHYADCYPPCATKCPADVDIKSYIELARLGENQLALEVIRESNPFPLVCGRVCVRYCEASCRRSHIDNPVAINSIKRYISDIESRNIPLPNPYPNNGKQIAIIGGGPAGLTAAYYLAPLGYKVKIFEAKDQLGGMLRWGIPDYRLPACILDREINKIISPGIEVEFNSALGRDFSITSLRKDGYEAILLAMGCQASKKMEIEDEDSEGVFGGVEFLEKVKRRQISSLNGTVVVVGGGNTAIDAARTALRLGSKEVKIVYRRTIDEMPADSNEIEDAIEEGVKFAFLMAPLAINSYNGRLKSIKIIKMSLSESKNGGRRRPVPVEGSEFNMECDYCISAIGQRIESRTLNALESIKLNSWNTIDADENTLMTSEKGVYAVGDVALGPLAVIYAIGAGKKVSTAIDHYLKTGEVFKIHKEFMSSKDGLKKVTKENLGNLPKIDRVEMMQTDAVLRIKNFHEVDQGIKHVDSSKELERCLSCGCTDISSCSLKKYADHYKVDPKKYKGQVNHYDIDMSHPLIQLDPNKCILCGLCVKTCEDVLGASVLGFVHRGSEMVVMPALGRKLWDTECISCGNCIDICPTGAISHRKFEHNYNFGKNTSLNNVCQFCSGGCELTFQKLDNTFWKVKSRKGHSFYDEYLCRRGRFAHKKSLTKDRTKVPRIRNFGTQKSVEYSSAIEKGIKELCSIKESFGPESICFLISPFLTNEEIYLTQKIAREQFNCTNVASLKDVLTPIDFRPVLKLQNNFASSFKLGDLDEAQVIIDINSDLEINNPALISKIRRLTKKSDTLFFTFDQNSKQYDDFCSLKIDTSTHGLSKSLLFITKLLDQGISTLDYFLAKDLDSLEMLARIISKSKKRVLFLYAPHNVTEKNCGILSALCDLVQLINKEHDNKSGVLFTYESPNYSGLANFGGVPDLFNFRKDFESSLWKNKISPSPVLGQMQDKLLGNEFKAFVNIGEDLLMSSEVNRSALRDSYLFTIDSKETETFTFSNCSIPGTHPLEKRGSLTTTDQRTISFEPTFPSPTKKSTLGILQDIYQHLSGEEMPLLNLRKEMEMFGSKTNFSNSEQKGMCRIEEVVDNFIEESHQPLDF